MSCNSLCGADCPWSHGEFCLCPLNAVCASKVCVSTLCFICILNLEETLLKKSLPGFKSHVLFVVCKLTCVLFHCPVELQLNILLNGWVFFFNLCVYVYVCQFLCFLFSLSVSLVSNKCFGSSIVGKTIEFPVMGFFEVFAFLELCIFIKESIQEI